MRLRSLIFGRSGYTFQSTYPGWGATHAALSRPCFHGFNPRTPDGVRRWRVSRCRKAGVSIRAPRMGCDPSRPRFLRWFQCFNPRTPDGVRLSLLQPRRCNGVSIRAPRMGCDTNRPGSLALFEFQSAHPGWGATDLSWDSQTWSGFNPRTPDGVRHLLPHDDFSHAVSIRAPRMGCDEVHI